MEYYSAYIIYLFCSIALTLYVGNHLYRNGMVWVKSLLADQQLAVKINDLLLLLYRVLNIGYILFTLMASKTPDSLRQSIEFLIGKLGLITLILAVLHFQNIISIYIFSRFKTNRHE